MVDPIEGEELDPDNPPVYGWRDAPVSGERVDLHEGPIIAGDPAGARVEVTETGLRAFDATGTETASIAGEGGEFVGGSFRTSDALPGQVTLSDTGFEDPLGSGIPGPGVGVTPRNPDGFTRLPGVGPSWGGMTVSGGRDAAGRWTTVEASPTSSTLRAVDEDGGGAGYISTAVGESTVMASGPNGESGEVRSTPASSRLRTRTAGGTLASEVNASPTSVTARTYGASGDSGWMRARPGDAELAYVDSLNTYFSRLRATDTEASMFTRAGGTNRYLTVDADGVWVRKGAESYNLEQLAKDTGRAEFPTVAGVTRVVAPTWRNKANMILFNGTVNKSWTVGWNSVAIGMPLVTRPEIEEVRNAPIPEPGYLIRITPGGALDVYAPTAGARDVRLSGLTYPLG